jgi:hypothetical protein
MSEEAKLDELPWDQTFGSTTNGYWYSGDRESFHFDNVKLTESAQEAAAQRALEVVKVLEKAITSAWSQGRDLYFRVTAGSKAGSIMRLVNHKNFKRHDDDRAARSHGGSKTPKAQSPKVVRSAHTWQGKTTGAFVLDGYLYWPRDDKFVFEIDGKKTFEFQRSDSTFRTMKPALLLDYNGPTIWQNGKPEKSRNSLLDRYGQTVNVGDVVLLGTRPSAVLLTGKVTKISDKKTIWVKHIGAQKEHMEMNCISDQLLKLKDVEKVLMMEKLKAL